MNDVRAKIEAVCDGLKAMLLAKNAAYGNSALEPVRVFSQADPVEQIKVRLDDKLSRLARGSAAGEDVLMDLIGYLVLLRIAEEGTEAQGHKGTEEEDAEVVHKVDLDDLCECGHTLREHLWPTVSGQPRQGGCGRFGCYCSEFRLRAKYSTAEVAEVAEVAEKKEEAEVVHKVDLDDLCVCGHARRLHTWDIEVPAARGRCVSQGCKCEKFKLA